MMMHAAFGMVSEEDMCSIRRPLDFSVLSRASPDSA